MRRVLRRNRFFGMPCLLVEKGSIPSLPLDQFPGARSSLKTTNCLESLNSLLEQRVAKVDRWQTSDQKQRWLAAALLDIEPRHRRLKGFHALPLLRAALERECQQAEEGTGLAVQAA